jgi:hypothetical protein
MCGLKYLSLCTVLSVISYGPRQCALLRFRGLESAATDTLARNESCRPSVYCTWRSFRSPVRECGSAHTLRLLMHTRSSWARERELQNKEPMNKPTSLAGLEQVVHYGRKTTDLFVRMQQGLLWPTVELLIRLWLAKAFFASGMFKVAHWQTALDLAANEYPVRFLPSVAAAHLGVSIEVLGAALHIARRAPPAMGSCTP